MQFSCRIQTLFAVYACLILATVVNYSESVKKSTSKVLILGAGAAGLAAAKTLSDNGIDDFIILEGTGRIGGRVKSVKFAGKTVEAGANWIVGKDGNPMYDIRKSENIQGKWSDWDSVIIRNSDGEDVTDTEGEDAWSKLDDAEKLFHKVAGRLEDGSKDMSTRSCLDIGKWRPKSPVENVVEIYDFDYEFGHLPDVTSCFAVDQAKDFLGKVYFIQDERGYEFLLQKYVEDVLVDNDPRLYLNEVVTSIKQKGPKVKVKTQTGNVFKADYVIMTFSVGVLKSGSVNFTPALPNWKIDSLFRIRLENFMGLYFKFPDTTSRFWDDTEFVLNADERRGYYPILQNLEADGLFPAGSNILEVMTFGEDADRVSQLTNSQITAEVMEMLRRIYKDGDIPEPEDMFFQNWRNDPLYLGSFCNLEPGSTSPEIYENIKAPVGRLHFAGEAYDRELAGYVFGALRSGINAALDVTKNMD